MEKTNELNKFLSYIHMGNSIFRIYYDAAVEINNKSLINELVEMQEIFKKHEEKITILINEMHEEATNSLTMAGVMGVYKEKMKIFDDSFSICVSAIKSTNMGRLSAIKFLYQNKEMPKHVKEAIENVINDYSLIIDKLQSYILEKLV